MIVKIKQIGTIKPPERANKTDAGYDIISVTEPEIRGELYKDTIFYKNIDYIEYKTNLFIAPQKDFHTLIHPRSSISNYNLVLANSVALIDEGYRNQISLRFKYIIQPEDIAILNVENSVYSVLCKINKNKIYKINEKIGQLVFEPTFYADFILTDKLDQTIRGEGGFGSSGK